VVSRVDEGLVLLQGALTPMSMVGGATVHALRSHMSPLNFCLKSSVLDFAQDLSGDAFVWASQNIGCRDVVE
jgi:hypothetical protein